MTVQTPSVLYANNGLHTNLRNAPNINVRNVIKAAIHKITAQTPSVLYANNGLHTNLRNAPNINVRNVIKEAMQKTTAQLWTPRNVLTVVKAAIHKMTAHTPSVLYANNGLHTNLRNAPNIIVRNVIKEAMQKITAQNVCNVMKAAMQKINAKTPRAMSASKRVLTRLNVTVTHNPNLKNKHAINVINKAIYFPTAQTTTVMYANNGFNTRLTNVRTQKLVHSKEKVLPKQQNLLRK